MFSGFLRVALHCQAPNFWSALCCSVIGHARASDLNKRAATLFHLADSVGRKLERQVLPSGLLGRCRLHGAGGLAELPPSALAGPAGDIRCWPGSLQALGPLPWLLAAPRISILREPGGKGMAFCDRASRIPWGQFCCTKSR